MVSTIGFDATAKSLHVGSLLQIMILRMLQKQGHKPIILIGGGTTKVGDPTGEAHDTLLIGVGRRLQCIHTHGLLSAINLQY